MSHRKRHIVPSALLSLLLCACAAKTQAPPPAAPGACAAGESAMAAHQLLLGRNIPQGGRVPDRAFRDFVSEIVAPAFPAGFSIIDAEGHYLHQGTKEPIREPSKIIVIIAPDTPETAARIAAIAAAYKSRFSQESAGIIRQPACASF